MLRNYNSLASMYGQRPAQNPGQPPQYAPRAMPQYGAPPQARTVPQYQQPRSQYGGPDRRAMAQRFQPGAVNDRRAPVSGGPPAYGGRPPGMMPQAPPGEVAYDPGTGAGNFNIFRNAMAPGYQPQPAQPQVNPAGRAMPPQSRALFMDKILSHMRQKDPKRYAELMKQYKGGQPATTPVNPAAPARPGVNAAAPRIGAGVTR